MSSQICSLLLILLFYFTNSETTVHIGALVPQDSPEGKTISYAVEYINSKKYLLPSKILKVRFPEELNDIHNNIVYEALHMVEEGISAIITPQGADDVLVLHRLLAPKSLTQIVPTETSDVISGRRHIVQMNTPNVIMTDAICGTLAHFNWTQIAVLTVEGQWGLYLQNLWKSCTVTGVSVRSLQEHKTPEIPAFVDVTLELAEIRRIDVRVIILFTPMANVPYIMESAYTAGLLETGYAWIVVDIHAQMGVMYEGAVPPGFPPYIKGLLILRPLISDGNLLKTFDLGWKIRDIPQSPLSALYSDAILLFAYTVHDWIADGKDFYELSIDLLGDGKWPIGSEFYDYMMKQRFNGVSREISFDLSRKTGTVTDNRFGLFNVGYGKSKTANDNFVDYETIGLSKIGQWQPNTGLIIYGNSKNIIVWLGEKESERDIPTDLPTDLHGRHFRVVTIESPPFVMIDPKGKGNKRYIGFLPEMLEVISTKLNFEYTLYEVEDGNWGSKDDNGRWSGVVGDIVKQRADFTLADLAVTSLRDEVVRYSQTYFRSGMALGMAVEDSQKEMFYWLSPLGTSVWAAVVLFGVICATAMTSYSKLSPFGYYGRYQHLNPDADADENKNKFSFKNCVYFVVSSFLQQGPDNGSPVCVSGRIVAMSWWVLCMLIVIMYTANLTANLTVSNMKRPIESLESLTKQSEYKFGSVGNTSYENIFKESKLPLYKKIYDRIIWLPTSSSAYERVTTEKFVFIWDSPQLDYNQHKYGCKYTRVGAEFGYSQYALAFPKNNETLDNAAFLIDKQILEMQETSLLKQTYEKWLEAATSGNCQSNSIGNDNTAITTYDLKGVFVVMFALLLLSFIAFMCEIVFAGYLDKRHAKNVSIAEAVKARWATTMNTIGGSSSNIPLSTPLAGGDVCENGNESVTTANDQMVFIQRLKALKTKGNALNTPVAQL